ncbi:MFS transporter [Streptomyces buecherae]|uniref:MFS transporter n=1 Tax=Streptomyces buecherae TaxID=2763006 RepID=UPI0033E8716A
MNFAPYRQVFGTPGLRPLMIIGSLAKVPSLGITSVLYLYVSHGLGLNFGLAGLVTAAWMIGVGVGSPLQGRAFDRYGFRPVLCAVILVQATFWSAGSFLPYPVLLCAAFCGGLFTLSAFTITRLALAVMVPEEIRHTAYVVESVSTDVSYMIGPSVGVLVITQVSPTTAFLTVGAMMVLCGIGYIVVNPPLQAQEKVERPGGPDEWLSVLFQLRSVLVATIGVSTAVVGLEVAALGSLQHMEQLRWSWVFLVCCGVSSIIGGLIYGAARRPMSALLIVALLGIAMMPMGLAQHWIWLCVLAVPANFLIAPALSGTADLVSRLAPGHQRGLAMGLYASALMVGNAVASPLAGTAQDLAGPGGAFAVIGTVSALTGSWALFLGRKASSPRPTLPEGEASLSAAK